jgi:hypothetical protein
MTGMPPWIRREGNPMSPISEMSFPKVAGAMIFMDRYSIPDA